jgi:hypothetical protein
MWRMRNAECGIDSDSWPISRQSPGSGQQGAGGRASRSSLEDQELVVARSMAHSYHVGWRLVLVSATSTKGLPNSEVRSELMGCRAVETWEGARVCVGTAR